MRNGLVTLFLCGDVMLGRGVDQILPSPGDPRLSEPYVRDARAYVRLAEAAHGRISQPVDAAWPWGDALSVLDLVAPDARLINLETSITRNDEFAAGKVVHYRMNPGNISCLTVARPDVCVLANNHVLDFGARGLLDTLEALTGAGLRAAGAGRDAAAARQPAVAPVAAGTRVVVLSCGTPSSGIPASWAAEGDLPGLYLLPALSAATAAEVTARLRAVKQPGDIGVVSIHWGSNWGYGIEPAQVRFARGLIDGGADIVHGHSSHHPRPIEVYQGKLVLYGCGDFIDDYEGIGGHERYRGDLRPMYFASVHQGTGQLAALRIVPLQARNLSLRRARAEDANWLRAELDRVSRRFGSQLAAGADGTLDLRWADQG